MPGPLIAPGFESSVKVRFEAEVGPQPGPALSEAHSTSAQFPAVAHHPQRRRGTAQSWHILTPPSLRPVQQHPGSLQQALFCKIGKCETESQICLKETQRVCSSSARNAAKLGKLPIQPLSSGIRGLPNEEQLESTTTSSAELSLWN